MKIDQRHIFRRFIFLTNTATVALPYTYKIREKYNGILDPDRLVYCWLGWWLDIENDLR